VQTLDDVIYIDSYPKLDLHGYDRETARVAIQDFIRDNIRLKQHIFVIVHGIGSGTLRMMTHEVLRRHKKVAEYKTFYYNPGSTIVRIID